jgi:hypothetical protein
MTNIHIVQLAVLLSLLLSACSTGGGQIQPYDDNPRYWQFEGDPVFLRGGSKEDNLFQISNLEQHLDQLASLGGNYIRNTMSSRDDGNIWPFYRQADGTYDLERLNDEYYERLERLLELTSERGIIVQIELWDRFDYAREPWLENPFRPANNVNYTVEESGLEDEYPRHPANNDNPFFRSVPAQDDNQRILRYQRAHIDSLLDISLEYPNVLYCMDNETDANPDWGIYWSNFVKQKAQEMGVEVQTTEMWDAWDLKDDQHKLTLDHPEQYSFVDISQNNHNTNQEHWDNLQWARNYTAERPRPLNHVKIYGADTGTYGTTRDGVERFWRSILGGGASVRFHRPESGIGLGETARAHVQSAGMLLAEFDLFRARPDTESDLLSDRAPDEAYLSFIPEEQYALYFTDGGSVQVDLSGTSGSFSVRWLDAEASSWQKGQVVEGGRNIELSAPGDGHWLVILTRG